MVATPDHYCVWADMSHLLAQETWPPGAQPASLHYLCGPLPDSLLQGDTADDHNIPQRALAQVHGRAQEWLRRYAGLLWRDAQDVDDRLRPSLFHRPGTADCGGILSNQYLRANIDPSERYVCSPAGGNLRRLPSDQSGFDNLVLAGDWTRTPINAGNIESTTMSGMCASRALCGHPARITGEHFLQA
jgi:hypothetical protein